ncbi:hypothetical protein BC939DRAFT_260225 [Gamsiella multidivaricata]|uniref:uncharacterized protein n=1 Tax=Gamsiella multidivaricata TaxID=101098 RepID=UPI002220EDEC|nr:uncharacterized protein BC939DRAFT_260225 [Gamsiella multidivaricata]KAI7830747.1 hypothetical protein BC939DRAFT_260225 [Gamsiella multidivaricata]
MDIHIHAERLRIFDAVVTDREHVASLRAMENHVVAEEQTQSIVNDAKRRMQEQTKSTSPKKRATKPTKPPTSALSSFSSAPQPMTGNMQVTAAAAEARKPILLISSKDLHSLEGTKHAQEEVVNRWRQENRVLERFPAHSQDIDNLTTGNFVAAPSAASSSSSLRATPGGAALVPESPFEAEPGEIMNV